MSRRSNTLRKSFLVATALTLGAPVAAFADDSSMSRFGGESYAYFNRPAVAAAGPSWHQSHPNGVPEQELQALSSSDLSAAASRFNPPVFARAAADPTWRETHPNGLTESELQALSSSSLAIWQAPNRSIGMPARNNVAQASGKPGFAVR
jgi:hypothetical protein